MNNNDVKESLFNSLVEDDEVSLSELIKDLLQERLEKRAFDLYTEELRVLKNKKIVT